jgi:hypothetical protein
LEETSGDNEHPHESSRKRAAPEQFAETKPPRNALGGGRQDGFFDNSFAFELGAKGNPDTLGRFDFGRHLAGDIHNARQVRNIVAALAALREVRVDFLGQRRQAFLLNNGFHFLTQHDPSLQRRPALHGRPLDFSQNLPAHPSSDYAAKPNAHPGIALIVTQSLSAV